MFSKFLWPCALLFFLFLLQNFMQQLFLSEQAPPLVLMAVVYYSMKKGVLSGAFLGFFAGLNMELFAQGTLGAFMVPMGLVGAFAGAAAAKIFRDSWPAALLVPCAAAYGLSLAQLGFLQMQAGGFSWSVFTLAFQWRILLWTLILSPFVFLVLGKIDGARPS